MSADETDPPWLDEAEMAAWSALIAVVMKLPNALDRQLRQDCGLTHFEFVVLTGLSRQPDRTLRLSVLAEFAGAALPRLSQVAGRLEQRGLLTRRTDPTDGRFTLATLTVAGFGELEAAAPGHVTEVRRLVFDNLSAAQVRQLAAIGRRIDAALEN